jgi:LysR family transcriptional regulator, glycine cleavage system transcriptional activator
MHKRLPPLNSLRAFECAARHQSISLAASELNVTPAAISQQIKLLEQVLDVQLFIRQNRQIELTEEGRLLKPLLGEAFEQIHQALQTLHTHRQGHPLTITAPHTFLAKWLIPRLDDFYQQHPQISVRIDASTRLVDFDSEDIDIGIRFSMQQDPDLVSTHLMTLQVIPVCSPEYMQKQQKLNTPADLHNQTLLHYDNKTDEPTWPDWNMWLASMGYRDMNTKSGIYFAQADMAIQAAIEGQGIALVPTIFTEKDIHIGRLVQPFSMSMPIDFSYYLVTTPKRANLPRVIAFKKWVLQQLPESK